MTCCQTHQKVATLVQNEMQNKSHKHSSKRVQYGYNKVNEWQFASLSHNVYHTIASLQYKDQYSH